MTGHGVYLICFDRPFKHAGHYLGWASNIAERVAEHKRTGRKCAKLLAAVNRAGITWEVVRTWPGLEKADERRLKNRGGSSRHCPRCKARALGAAN
jgi:hypothetical protein